MSFNIRVYGILMRAENEVLVTDEKLSDLSFTKFPGGGLEFGEGIRECLKREFLEELQLPIKIVELFYLTEHFQPSAFSKKEQVISIYYKVTATKKDLLILDDYVSSVSKEAPRWINTKDLNESEFMFPIDKIVVKKLLNN